MPALKKVEKPGKPWAVTNLVRPIAAPRVRFPAPAAAIRNQSAAIRSFGPRKFLKNFSGVFRFV
jgi:hypothetical protein